MIEFDTKLKHELDFAAKIREFAYAILLGEHKGEFERKDYIAFVLFSRCLQTQESIEILIKSSLVDDAWILIRALVEHSVNCAYFMQAADAQIADDFAAYPQYERWEEMQSLKATNEELFRRLVTVEEEEKAHKKFDTVRTRFDGKRGDRWCPDDRLYKRAMRVDAKMSDAMGEVHREFLWMVNSAWRHGSGYVHGAADALAPQVRQIEDGVTIQRAYTT